jgi:parallel beta-helix repeat protein
MTSSTTPSLAPPTAGITISGDGSDNNEVSNNTIIGAGQRGIDINDGDSALLINNTVTGGAQDGIELRGSATGALMNFNTANANLDDGSPSRALPRPRRSMGTPRTRTAATG